MKRTFIARLLMVLVSTKLVCSPAFADERPSYQEALDELMSERPQPALPGIDRFALSAEDEQWVQKRAEEIEKRHREQAKRVKLVIDILNRDASAGAPAPLPAGEISRTLQKWLGKLKDLPAGQTLVEMGELYSRSQPEISDDAFTTTSAWGDLYFYKSSDEIRRQAYIDRLGEVAALIIATLAPKRGLIVLSQPRETLSFVLSRLIVEAYLVSAGVIPSHAEIAHQSTKVYAIGLMCAASSAAICHALNLPTGYMASITALVPLGTALLGNILILDNSWPRSFLPTPGSRQKSVDVAANRLIRRFWISARIGLPENFSPLFGTNEDVQREVLKLITAHSPDYALNEDCERLLNKVLSHNRQLGD